MERNPRLTRREMLALTAAAAAAVAAPWSGLAPRPAAAAGRLRIVDAHVHMWSGGKPTAAQRQQPVSQEQLLQEMDEAGIDRAVVVPASWDPRHNQTALDAAKAHPDRFAVMGLIDIAKAENRPLVETWKLEPGMLGVRLFLGTPQAAAALTDGSADWFWPAAEAADIAVMVHAGGLVPTIGTIAERHPGLRLCVDSLGAAPRTIDAAAFADLPKLLALARLPNVAVKAEGVPTQSTEPYPHRNLHPYLRQVYDAFGPERLFWGSDITRLKTPYRESVTLFTEALTFLSDRDRELIMGRALATWIKWPLPD